MLFIKLFLVYNNNCSIDVYNRDLQTTIILFTCNVSSHKTDWILSELPLLALSCLLYCRLSSLRNALKGECLCLLEISVNEKKVVYIIVFVYFVYAILVVLLLHVYLFISIFFILILLLYFYLFIDYVNKFIVLFLELLFIILITPFPLS